jgi:acyl carrier protein
MLGAKRQSIDPQRTFGQLGVDSVVAMEALLELENAYNLVLEPTHFYEHPSPRALAAWIARMIGKQGTAGASAPQDSSPANHREVARRAAAS